MSMVSCSTLAMLTGWAQDESQSVNSLPDPAFKRGNASAIFGAGPSFGINPAVPSSEESERFKPSKPVVRRNSQRKLPQERPTVRRSKSDVVSSRRAIERRRSRDLERNRKFSESTVNGKESPTASPSGSTSPRSVSENSVDGEGRTQTRIEENGVRYPLFVPVASGLVSPGRTRVAKPVTKRTPNTGRNQKPNLSTADNSGQKPIAIHSKSQNGFPVQRVVKTNRSGSAADIKKSSCNQQQTVRSPHSSINRPRAVSSSKQILKTTGESSTLPRAKSPTKKTVNEETKSVSNNSCGSPRNSYLQQKHEGEISRTSSQSSVYSSPAKLSHIDKRENMSKIPSLVRTPSTDKQESKLPSRNPPKSKIPSISKADSKPQKIKEPEPKKSQIPGLTRSDSNKGLVKSKIPSSTGSTAGRPDSAKENQDPVINDSAQEGKTHKPTSRIPSFSSGPKSSKIPSRHESPVHNEPVVSQSSPKEDHVDSSNKVKSTGIPMSRIPSFGKGTIDKPSFSGPAVQSSLPQVQEQVNNESSSSVSKIPSRIPKENDSATTPESRIPQKSESSSQKSRIPGHTLHSTQPESKISIKEEGESNSGIPKPHVNGVFSPTTTDIPSPTENKSKLPGVSKSLETEIPSSKPAVTESNEQLVEDQVVDMEVSSDETPVKREESPIEKYIRSEAQKVEKLLRDEKVLVEVRTNTKMPEENDVCAATIKSQENQKVEKVKEKLVLTKPSPEAVGAKQVKSEPVSPEDKEIVQDPAGALISDVLTSYAPDLKTSEDKGSKPYKKQEIKPLEVKKPVGNETVESKLKAEKLASEKTLNREEKKAAPEQIDIQLNSNGNGRDKTVDDIYFQTFGSFGKRDNQESPPISRDKDRPMPPKRNDSLGSKDAKDMGLIKKVEKPQVLDIEPSVSNTSEANLTPTETLAIDTLGQYEQQSRRSKSRNRKIISPDGENDMDFAAATKEQPQAMKDINKDKYGSSPYSAEDEKTKVPKKTSKHDKPKFVIESSLGKDFYEAKRDSVPDADTRPDSLVIANKTMEPRLDAEEKEKNKTMVVAQESPKNDFEDVDLATQKESMKEILRSVDDLDGTAKCVGCGGRGKCVIS